MVVYGLAGIVDNLYAVNITNAVSKLRGGNENLKYLLSVPGEIGPRQSRDERHSGEQMRHWRVGIPAFLP